MAQQSDRLSLAPALLHSSKRGISDAGNDAGADYGACRCLHPLCQSHPARCQLLPVSLCSAPSQPGGLQSRTALLSRLPLGDVQAGLFLWQEQALGLWQQSPCPMAAPAPQHWLRAPWPSGNREHGT